MPKRPALFTTHQLVLLGACFLILGLFSGFNFIFGIFLNPLIEEFGWARSTASAAYSINMFTIGATAMLAGGMADRFGTRPVVLVGSLLGGLSLLLASSIQNLWQYFLLVGVMAGLGRSCFMAPVQAFIQRSFTRSRGLATGLAGSGTGMGVVLMAPMTGYLIGATGWRATYLVLGLVFLAVAIPASFLLRPPREEPPGAAPAAAAPAAQRHYDLLPEASLGMGAIIRRRPFWAVLGSHTFDCVCHSVLLVHLVPMAIEAGIGRVQAASLLGVMGGGAILGRIFIGMLSDRVGAKRALLLTLLCQTLPVPLLLWADSVEVFYATAAMVGLGLGGHGTMYPLVTREFYGPKRVGLLFGAFSTGASTGMASGGFMGGLLYDLSGSYTLSIWFSFLVGVVSVLLVMLYPARRPRAPAAAEAAPENLLHVAG